MLNWNFPVTGAKTLSGLIIEMLESIPAHGVCLLINGHPVEVVQVRDNKVKTARIAPQLSQFYRQTLTSSE